LQGEEREFKSVTLCYVSWVDELWKS
jgi:hypothetical protein